MVPAVAAGSVSSNIVVPGVLGFLVVAGMGVALFFLLRSMNKQLRKVAPPPPPRSAKTGSARAGSARAGSAKTSQAAGGEPGSPGPSDR
jgi:hypothetical protein